MRYIVLFQGSCSACSAVAQIVRDISIAQLEARPLDDPQVAELLRDAGAEPPGRPSLLIIDDGDVKVTSGWAMRRRLARVVGWRRSGTIVRLLAAEWRARLARSAGSHLPSRRKVLGGAVAGAVAGGFIWGLKPPNSSPGSATRNPDVTTASPAEAAALLATASVQRSIHAWGPVRDISKVNGEQPVFVLSHTRNGIMTVVDNSANAVETGNPAALSMGKSPGSAYALRYYTVDGSPVVDVGVSDGITTVALVQNDEPDSLDTEKWRRFVACVATVTTPACAQTCINCVAHPTAICTAACIACAGPAAMKCAFYIWN